MNEFDKTKIREGYNISVSQIIYALSKCPPNAELTICGSSKIVLHQSLDGKYVCLDYETLSEAYDLEDNEKLEPMNFADVFIIDD